MCDIPGCGLRLYIGLVVFSEIRSANFTWPIRYLLNLWCRVFTLWVYLFAKHRACAKVVRIGMWPLARKLCMCKKKVYALCEIQLAVWMCADYLCAEFNPHHMPELNLLPLSTPPRLPLNILTSRMRQPVHCLLRVERWLPPNDGSWRRHQHVASVSV